MILKDTTIHVRRTIVKNYKDILKSKNTILLLSLSQVLDF